MRTSDHFSFIVAAGPPSILNVTTVGTDKIFLRWQSPEKLYREIDKYQIEIADQDSYFIRTEIIPSNKLHVNTDLLLFYFGLLKSEITAPKGEIYNIFSSYHDYYYYCNKNEQDNGANIA